MKDFEKRFMKKDGSQRITFFRDEDADNPRYMTDEPLHCEDWDSNYTIMDKGERATQSSDARDRIVWLLRSFGDDKNIIDLLIENGKHMTDGNSTCNNALVYDRSARRWVLKEYSKWFGEKDFNWKDSAYFDCKRDEIDLCEVLESVKNSTIDFFIEQGCLTDEVKVMSYGFGNYGEVSFYGDFSTDSEGIAWLEKDEFLTYSGCSEDFWRDNDCLYIAKWLVDELEAWSNGEVYGYEIENCIKSKIHKEYANVEREAEDYEEEEWEEKGSCWGYYGELDKVVDIVREELGMGKDFEEVTE